MQPVACGGTRFRDNAAKPTVGARCEAGPMSGIAARGWAWRAHSPISVRASPTWIEVRIAPLSKFGYVTEHPTKRDVEDESQCLAHIHRALLAQGGVARQHSDQARACGTRDTASRGPFQGCYDSIATACRARANGTLFNASICPWSGLVRRERLHQLIIPGSPAPRNIEVSERNLGLFRAFVKIARSGKGPDR
jgi:hypothetical protein